MIAAAHTNFPEAPSGQDRDDYDGWWAGVATVVAASPQPLAILSQSGHCLVASSSFRTALGHDDTAGDSAALSLPANATEVALTPPRGRRCGGSPPGDGTAGGVRLISLPAPVPEGHDMLVALLNALPVMVSAKDRDGRYLFMNACHAAHYGIKPQDAAGQKTADLAGERYARVISALDQSVLRSGCPTGFIEEDAASADGEIRNWLISKSPLVGADGRGIGVATVALDVSAAKAREEALIQARDRAEEAGRTRGRYLATVGHELRTPLHSIVGFSDFLAQETLGPLGHPTYREYAQDILTAGRHLLDVVTDILDMARLEAGRLPLEEEPLNLCRSVGDAVRMLAIPAKHKGTAIRIGCDDTLPAVIADARRMRQVTLNLLNNAIKYTPAGGEIAVFVGREDNGDVVLEIADNGVGIAPEDLPTAMAPFGRLQPALGGGQTGVGLGLPLVKALLEAHGGRLELLSKQGEGTRARAILPRYRLRP